MPKMVMFQRNSMDTKQVLPSLGNLWLKHSEQEGKWSWEKTVYPALSKDIHVHIDNTKFWDMGTPERLERLEEFFNESRS